jgi:hypothetical protein
MAQSRSLRFELSGGKDYLLNRTVPYRPNT